MKVTYTGNHEQIRPHQQRKLEVKFAKLGKLIDKRGEKEAHVILASERHLHRAEITVRLYDRAFVGVAHDPDLFNSICSAIEKLEKQIQRLREKRRDSKRGPKTSLEAESPEDLAAAMPETEGEEVGAGRVYRVSSHDRRKPMTLEEALLEIEPDQPYLAYRDADTDGLAVLIRRSDGDFDLIQG